MSFAFCTVKEALNPQVHFSFRASVSRTHVVDALHTTFTVEVNATLVIAWRKLAPPKIE